MLLPFLKTIIMALVYYFKDLKIENIESHSTWEDAYLAVMDFAEKNDLQLTDKGAKNADTNHFVHIFN